MILESSLKISGVAFPAFTCRDATQTLTPISKGKLYRSVNGELCHVATKHHDKYKSTIMCADKNLPGLQQLWVGCEVKVNCLSRLWERFVLSEERKHSLSRTAQAGSLVVSDVREESVEFSMDDGVLTLPQGEGEEVLVSYRPVLKMRIKTFVFKDAEWEEGTAWRLDLEEI